MTLEAIKREITVELKKVKRQSSEYSAASNYDDLQKILTKAIVETASCENVNQLAKIENYLDAVETAYSSCRSEVTGIDGELRLFHFDFEIDEEPQEKSSAVSDEDEPDEIDEDEYEAAYEEEETTDEKPALDIDDNIVEIEDSYDKYDDRCGFVEKCKLKALRKKSKKAVKAATTRLELFDATRAYRRGFKQFDAMLNKRDSYRAARAAYDDRHKDDNLKKTNLVRMTVGFAAMLFGVIFGFVKGWTSKPVWAIAALGFGLCCLLLTLITALADSKRKETTVRRLTQMRIVTALPALILGIVLGVVVFDGFEGVLAGIVALAPFSICGAARYGIYRMKLTSSARKIQKEADSKK